jgi:hypothetical protein
MYSGNKYSILIFTGLAGLVLLSSFSKTTGKQTNFSEGKQDTIVPFAKRYISYMDNLASKGSWNKKTYIKRINHSQYNPVINENWPDSIEETVYVFTFKEVPVIYTEVPISQENNYKENNWYFYKGSIIARKNIIQEFSSKCTKDHGLLDIESLTIYDTTGSPVIHNFTVKDSKNRPVNAENCNLKTDTNNVIYRTFNETPLVRSRVKKN